MFSPEGSRGANRPLRDLCSCKSAYVHLEIIRKVRNRIAHRYDESLTQVILAFLSAEDWPLRTFRWPAKSSLAYQHFDQLQMHLSA